MRWPLRDCGAAIVVVPYARPVTIPGIRLLLPAVLALSILVATPHTVQAEPVPAHPEPLLHSRAVGDPSVVQAGRRVVVVATGPQVSRAYKDPGRRWRWTEPVLARRPDWAKRKGEIWAADMARVKRRWVLYYAVPVAGLGPYGRCIGVAVARRPLDRFRPVGDAPLVCPSAARVPVAADPIAVPDLTVTGAIDPSYHRERGRSYLLYKTDGKPSSIRLLPLSKSGRRAHAGVDPLAPSTELVRAPGVIENPVLLKRGGSYYLFASEGDFARCSYSQTWRRSTSLSTWTPEPGGVLLSRDSTGGLCGPAGGDVLVHRSRTTLYFHGWVRGGTTRPKGANFWAWGHPGKARRAMYAARLTFPGGVPTVKRYLD